MTVPEREMMARRLDNDIKRERSACEYYSLMASVTHRIESSNVFMTLADVRLRNLKRAQKRYAQLHTM